jgi:hypothetical protein
LNRTSLRLGFCAAVAVIAAAIADPIVEFASNAGCFGAGRFTDRSNLDVAPAIAVGVALLVWYLIAKAHAVLAGRALPQRIAPLLPLIFILQMITLWAMETAEQLTVYEHVIGPRLWLGGPLECSLAIHALLCVAVTLIVARSLRRLAVTTLRVIALIKTTASFAAHAFEMLLPRRCDERSFRQLVPVLCRIGERAPPLVRA